MSLEDPQKRYRPSRRDLLTGRVVQKTIEQSGNDLADSLVDIAQALPPPAKETVRLNTRAMACEWSVVMNPGPPRQVMVASDALDLVHAAEQLLTVYREDSDVSRLNSAAVSDWTAVNAELFAFLQICQSLFEATEGYFDPAAGALIRVWKEARASGVVPEELLVLKALENSGFGNIELNSALDQVRFRKSHLSLDFASIGKGYAVDLAAKHVATEGVTDFLVHGGHSSLIAMGKHAGYEGWPVGIRNPLFTDRRYLTVMLKNQAMSTSGSNVQFFRHNGRRYGHLLNPKTGWPAEGLLSVSVVTADATTAEALSTAFYVMGLEKAVQYCEAHPEVGAILVPPPARSRILSPVFCNLQGVDLYFEPEEQDGGKINGP